MCLVCDIFKNRIDSKIAQKINSNQNLRLVYDKLRGSNCDGKSPDEIIQLFKDYSWNGQEIVNNTVEMRNRVDAMAKKKKEIRKEASVLK